MSRFRHLTLEQAIAAACPDGPMEWPQDTVPKILELLWLAYDRLCVKLKYINIQVADLQLERSVVALLADEIQDILDEEGGYASYRIAHERFEMETLDPNSNRPPQYDLAFVWREHVILKWPCEAKVLSNERDIREYLLDVQDAFVPCIYAPFSSSAAMLGLLVSGRPNEALRLIASRFEMPLIELPQHSHRPHRQCSLPRKVPAGKRYPTPLILHHLIFKLPGQ